ncbi:MAG: hypothetical protein HFJ37_05135 [Clostridia bacterium]|nr:hypothetical protein [Clostridia bacterium]
MNKKTIYKVLIMLMMSFMVISTMLPVFAAPDPSKYDGSGATANTDKIDTLGQNIISIVSTVGSIVSVVVLIVLGVKYMMGSAEEKAEYKKTLLPYIIGAALVFAASTIASVVFNFANTVTV